MRSRTVLLCVSLLLLTLLGACSDKPRIIPEKKMIRIYKDMFVADSWLRDNLDARRQADSALVYDPIFERYGYRFEDFDASFRHYLDDPDRFLEMLTQASEEIRVVGEQLQTEGEAERERQQELDAFRRAYTRKDFSSESGRWDSDGILWSGHTETLNNP